MFMSRMKHSALPTRYCWFSCQRSRSLECRWMFPHCADLALTRGMDKPLPASTPAQCHQQPLGFQGCPTCPSGKPYDVGGPSSWHTPPGSTRSCGIPKAVLSSLLGPFMFPFCWEAADVRLMSSHVVSEVLVEVAFGLVALRKQPQE